MRQLFNQKHQFHAKDNTTYLEKRLSEGRTQRTNIIVQQWLIFAGSKLWVGWNFTFGQEFLMWSSAIYRNDSRLLKTTEKRCCPML